VFDPVGWENETVIPKKQLTPEETTSRRKDMSLMDDLKGLAARQDHVFLNPRLSIDSESTSLHYCEAAMLDAAKVNPANH
jgi:hypothetical protein